MFSLSWDNLFLAAWQSGTVLCSDTEQIAELSRLSDTSHCSVQYQPRLQQNTAASQGWQIRTCRDNEYCSKEQACTTCRKLTDWQIWKFMATAASGGCCILLQFYKQMVYTHLLWWSLLLHFWTNCFECKAGFSMQISVWGDWRVICDKSGRWQN